MAYRRRQKNLSEPYAGAEQSIGRSESWQENRYTLRYSRAGRGSENQTNKLSEEDAIMFENTLFARPKPDFEKRERRRTRVIILVVVSTATAAATVIYFSIVAPLLK